jgi:hypothetical protein
MDAQTLMLLMVQLLAVVLGCLFLLWIIFLQRRNRAAERIGQADSEIFPPPAALLLRPNAWVAVRSLEAEAVRAALKNKDGFFTSPRVNGWVIVTGPGLPNPSEDVDACHLFLTALSRELGHVQFFYMEKFSAHHAWARMDDGCVTRAYAWAGETIWNQGVKTLAEGGLGLNCPGYGEDGGTESWARREKAAANVEKIPRLAARWSLDPGILRRTEGRAGGSPRFN